MANGTKKKGNMLIPILIIAAVVVFGLAFLIITLVNQAALSSGPLTRDQAADQLAKRLKKVDVQTVDPVKGTVSYDEADLREALPSIDKYPLAVSGSAALNIEIMTSTEKGGTGNDGWLVEVAEKFNREGISVAGKRASVSIRSVSSGVAADYILSGKHVPQGFTPSNELWGAMIEAAKLDIQLIDRRIAGNTTGVVLKKSKYEEIQNKYGKVDIDTIVTATIDDGLAMGYTNPFASSTGLNFILATLYSADKSNPLSGAAIEKFEKFQTNVPFVAYTTIQMRDAATRQGGSLDGMVLERQNFNGIASQLKDFEFVPFGVRHDSPMYATGKLSDDELALLKEFTNYCKNADNQQLATKYGFNDLEDYRDGFPAQDGATITRAQGIWKEKKDAGRPVAAVFIADVSGSMGDQNRLTNLKSSLLNSANYIGENCQVGLVSYNSRVYINLPVAKFDMNQRAYFAGAVEDMSANGNTATYDAVLVGLDMLREVYDKDPTTKLMLFVLSDGEKTAGYDLSDIENVVKGLGIPVNTIGYSADAAQDEMTALAGVNEGANINADSDDVLYTLKNLFNAQM